jgi:hypothetical protein
MTWLVWLLIAAIVAFNLWYRQDYVPSDEVW